VAPPPHETAEQASAAEPLGADDGGTWRVTLRLPGGLRPRVEAAACRDGISLNTWLVRAAAAAAGPATGRHVTGWVR
jgi:predicted HicB family RNase H-like nuclease